MLSAIFRRLSTWTDKPSGFIFFGGLVLSLFLAWQYQTGIRVGDGAIKQQQVADLLKKGFPDFSCHYSGTQIDPEYRFLPLDMKRGATMTHVFQGKCYYVFPFYYSAIQIPFVLVFGRIGSFLLSFLFGLGTLYASYLISVRLRFKATTRFIYLIFLIFGSAFSLFATDLSETILAIFGVTLGIHFLIRLDEDPNPSDLLFAGLLFGFASLFRQEVILLAVCIAVFHSLRILQKPVLLLFPFSFLAFLLLQVGLNQAVVGHPLGSRGYLQGSNTDDWNWIQQTLYLKELLFYGKGSLGLLGAYPFLIVFLRWKKADFCSSINSVFFGILLFILASALLTSQKFWQGVMFGPRFLMTILPISFLFGFAILEKHWNEDAPWLRWVTSALIAYSLFGALNFDRLYHKFTSSIVTEQKALSEFSDKTVIYRKNSVFLPPNSFATERNVYELDDEKDFDLLLEKLNGVGIGSATIIGFKDQYPKERLVPESKKFIWKKRNFHQSQSINLETLEWEKK